jgi:hypothetical protein
MNIRFDKVDPRMWANLGTQVGNAYVQGQAGNANAAGMQQQTQLTTNFGQTDPNAVYAGEGADGAMTNAEAASFGVNIPVQDKAAGTGVTQQYGLGVNPQSFQDTEFTPEQKRQSGLKSQAAFYAARGNTDQSNRITSQIQQGTMADMQLAQGARQAARDVKLDENTALMAGIDQETGAADLARRTGPDGKVRNMTHDDSLYASAVKAGLLAKAGKMTEAGAVMKDINAQSFTKIQLESAQRDQDLGRAAAALAAGDPSGIQSFYDTHVPDGAKVISVTPDGKGNITIERETLTGVPMESVTKTTGELLAGLNSFKDPMALYNFSQNEFKNNLLLSAEKRGNRSLAIQEGSAAIQATAANAKQEDRTTKNTDIAAARTANVDYEVARQAGDQAGMQAATLAIIQAGGTTPGMGSDKDPSEVKLARAMMQAGLEPNMRAALERAISKNGSSPASIHQDLVTASIKNMDSAENSVKKADEVMAQMGYTKTNGRWGTTAPGSAPAAPAAAANRKVGDEVTILGGPNKGKTAVWDGKGWLPK